MPKDLSFEITPEMTTHAVKVLIRENAIRDMNATLETIDVNEPEGKLLFQCILDLQRYIAAWTFP